MKRSFFSKVVLLLLVNSSSLVTGKFWGNRNELNEIDIDAATGTVKTNTEKEDVSCDGQLAAAVVKAQDLVKILSEERDEARSDHNASLEKIDQLQKTLAEAERKLIFEQDARGALEIEMAHALKVEKERSTKELNATKVYSTQNLESVKGEFEDRIQSLTTAKDGIIAELESKLQMSVNELESTMAMELQKAKEDKETSVAAIEVDRDEKLQKLTEEMNELKTTMAMELQKAKEEKETSVAAIEADRNEKLRKLTEEMNEATEALQKDRDLKIADLTALMNKAVENAQEDRDAKVAEFTAAMNKAARDADEILRQTKKEAETNLSKLMKSTKDDLTQSKIQCDSLVANKENHISSLKKSITRLSREKSSVETLLDDANLEIDRWTSIYNNRSYCNMTYITNDLYEFGSAVYSRAIKTGTEIYVESHKEATLLTHQISDHISAVYSQAIKTGSKIYVESHKQATLLTHQVSDHVMNGYKYSSRFMSDQFDEHWPTIQPFYNDYIVDNYEEYAEPHLRVHVFPVMQRAKDWYHEELFPWTIAKMDDYYDMYKAHISPLVENITDEVEDIYQKMVLFYGDKCSSTLKNFLKISKNSDKLKQYPPPQIFIESWKKSCAHPQETISVLGRGTIILLLFCFRYHIFFLVKFVVRFFFSLMGIVPSVIVYITPLRFILSGKTELGIATALDSVKSETEETKRMSEAIVKVEPGTDTDKGG